MFGECSRNELEKKGLIRNRALEAIIFQMVFDFSSNFFFFFSCTKIPSGWWVVVRDQRARQTVRFLVIVAQPVTSPLVGFQLVFLPHMWLSSPSLHVALCHEHSFGMLSMAHLFHVPRPVLSTGIGCPYSRSSSSLERLLHTLFSNPGPSLSTLYLPGRRKSSRPPESPDLSGTAWFAFLDFHAIIRAERAQI